MPHLMHTVSSTRARAIAASILIATSIGTGCTRPPVSSTVAGPAAAADAALGPAIVARETPRFPATWHFRAGEEAPFARHAMVVTNSDPASLAGVEILRRGGNAVDAAVAVGFALSVTFPAAGNIGGGGFMVIRMADGRVATIDYREVAPLAATRDMYLDERGELTDRSVTGHLAAGVPGAVAGLAEALRRYGTMSLQDVMAPAIRLAEQGFVVDSALSDMLRADRERLTTFAGRDVYFPNGQVIAPGSTWRQPTLARTLRLIARGGPDAFYRGEIADSIVAEMKRGGGIITKADLAAYRAEWREPIRTSYRGHQLFAMPPASSGGITMAQTLNILETYDTLPPFHTAAYKHLLAEAFRRAFIDRNTKLGDPAFVDVPIEQLTSKAYARELRQSISPTQATRTPTFTAAGEGMHTTHYSVVDAAGNAVATTTTINSSHGSAAFVAGAGFLLNNEMDDFAARPGYPNQFGLVQGEQNAIVPGKRMLSAMSPTIVLDPRGEVLLIAGAAGGPRIITATTQVILNVIDHRMNLADAMRAPRIHHQAWPDSLRYETGGLHPEESAELVRMGHGLLEIRSLATENAIMRVPGGWHGVVEPRSSGGARGY